MIPCKVILLLAISFLVTHITSATSKHGLSKTEFEKAFGPAKKEFHNFPQMAMLFQTVVGRNATTGEEKLIFESIPICLVQLMYSGIASMHHTCETQLKKFQEKE